MNWQALYTFVTSLLFGYEMDQTLFQTFLDSAQQQIEGMRPWMSLRAFDSSQTCSPATTFTTPFQLGSVPLPFLKFFGYQPIVLTDANNNPFVLKEIPFAQRFQYKNNSGFFCVDYVNKVFYLMGTFTQSYTINQTYIYRSARIDISGDNTWALAAFDSDNAKLLGFLVALKWKGIDYDIINLQNATQLGQAGAAIIDIMTRWDSDLQVNSQAGVDPFGNGNIDWQAGRLPGGMGPS